MVGWHDRLNGNEFEQAPGDNEGQSMGSESDRTERLNNRSTLPVFYLKRLQGVSELQCFRAISEATA